MEGLRALKIITEAFSTLFEHNIPVFIVAYCYMDFDMLI
jgi:hypothetical protein